MVALVLIIVCAGWIIWRRWGRGRLPIAPVPSGHMPRETLAFEAFMRGNSCLREGQFADALPCYRQALQAKPDYADAWNNQGLALTELGRLEDRRVLADGPDLRALLRQDVSDLCHGWLLFRAGGRAGPPERRVGLPP